MKLLLGLILSISACHTIVFNPNEWHAEWVFPAQTAANRGWWQRITGPDPWLTNRLMYDDTGSYWLVQEGSEHYWLWVPVERGDVITIDELGTIRVKR